MTSDTFYRFESNVRAAAVLGIVGAGGIGMSLSESLRRVIIEGEGRGRFLLVALVTTTVIILCEWLVRATGS